MHLVNVESTCLNESMTHARLKAATFPAIRTFDEFTVQASSVSSGTLGYLDSLKLITAQKALALIGPAGQVIAEASSCSVKTLTVRQCRLGRSR